MDWLGLGVRIIGISFVCPSDYINYAVTGS